MLNHRVILKPKQREARREGQGFSRCLFLHHKVEAKTFLWSGSLRSYPRLPCFLGLSKAESMAIKLGKCHDLGKGKTCQTSWSQKPLLSCAVLCPRSAGAQSVAKNTPGCLQSRLVLVLQLVGSFSHLMRSCAKNCLGLLDTLINKIVKVLCPQKTYSLANRHIRELNY